MTSMLDYPLVRWNEAGEEVSARWRSEKNRHPPHRIQVIDDRLSADAAYRLACEGTALLWRGDFQNARQLLHALSRRIDKKSTPRAGSTPHQSITTAFHAHRQAQAQRAHILGQLLIPVRADHSIPLRRAPDVRLACLQTYGSCDEDYIVSLRELQGVIGAYEWRKKGIEIPVLQARIHPHYGVFSPIRNEYVELIDRMPLPDSMTAHSTAFDIGTGTGILAALLVRRGIQHIVATDQDMRALECARENLTRLNFMQHVDLVQTDLFPIGQAALIVCNPPWIPARPSSPLEHAIFDPDSRMLKGFLRGLGAHLIAGGEGWLILSDFAEHLGLRSRETLLALIDEAGLIVLDRSDIKPCHPRVDDIDDPLHVARAAEITSLWRLASK